MSVQKNSSKNSFNDFLTYHPVGFVVMVAIYLFIQNIFSPFKDISDFAFSLTMTVIILGGFYYLALKLRSNK